MKTPRKERLQMFVYVRSSFLVFFPDIFFASYQAVINFFFFLVHAPNLRKIRVLVSTVLG